MTKEKAILWLRIGYRTGAVMDGLVAVGMIFPQLLKRAYGLTDFQPGPPFVFAMRFGAALMLGWTALLLWADRKPAERRGILLLTVFVVVGLILSEANAVASGFIPFKEMIPTWGIQVALMALFLFGFMNASRIPKSAQE